MKDSEFIKTLQKKALDYRKRVEESLNINRHDSKPYQVGYEHEYFDATAEQVDFASAQTEPLRKEVELLKGEVKKLHATLASDHDMSGCGCYYCGGSHMSYKCPES